MEHRDKLLYFATQSMLRDMSDFFFVKNKHLIYVVASTSFCRLVGASSTADIVGKLDSQVFHDPDLVRRYQNDDRQVLTSGQPLEAYIETIQTEAGCIGYCQTSKYPLFDETGEVIGLYGLARDITREYQAKLHYEQELQALFTLSQDSLGAVLFDVTNWRFIDTRLGIRETDTSIAFDTVDEFFSSCLSSLANEDDEVRDFFRSCSREFFQTMFDAGTRRRSLVYQRQVQNRPPLWIRHDLYLLADPVNGNLCVLCSARDIDEEKRAEHALVRAAAEDALTGLYNRETTMSHIQQFLTGDGAGGTHLLFMIDVDNFKQVNDLLGHQAGDEALTQLASAIRNALPDSTIVGRVGGDEFFALLKDTPAPSAARQAAQTLVQALQYRCTNGSAAVSLSGSVGISRYAGDGKTLEQLYAEADAALYQAKLLGKSRYIFADDSADLWADKQPLSTVNLRMLLENMDAALFQTELTCDGQVRITYSSHSLFSGPLLAQAGSSARGEDVWSVLWPEDLTMLQQAIRDATAAGTPLDCTCRVNDAHGQTRWRHICGSHLPPLDDGIHRMTHVVTDITRQKQNEEQLLEKNNILDLAMRNTDVNVWYYDFETSQCHLTPNCQRAHEMPGVETLQDFPECLISMDLVRFDCVEPLRTAYEQLRRTGKSVTQDVWFRRADGIGWWCERCTISPLAQSDGTVTRSIGIGKDITSEKQLAEQYARFGAYRHLAEKNTRVSFRMNLHTGWFGECASTSEAVQDFHTYQSADDVLALLRQQLVTEAGRQEFDQQMTRPMLREAFSRGESMVSLENLFHVENGRIIWLRITAEMMRNPTSGDVEALLYTFDIDHEKNLQLLMRKLLDEDYEFLGLIDIATGQLMVFEGENSPQSARNGVNYDQEAQRIFRGMIPEEYYEESVRTTTLSYVMQVLQTRNSYACSFPARAYAHTGAGRKQWKFSYLDSSQSKILVTRADITGVYTAEYDSLTGLLNRETFYRQARKLFDAHRDTAFLLIRFDIDRFKAYNDVYGTQAGDRLLAALGRTLRENPWPETAVLGRLEADHFVLVVPSLAFDIAAWSTAHRARLDAISGGYRLRSSVGVYRITDPTLDISLMCDRAMLAQRTVKENYAEKVAWYDDRLRTHLMHEQALADEMEQALQEGQFILYFQPQIDFSTGRMIGAEALVRWLHPVHGLIPPGEFIPLFEKNGFILKLDAFVWETVCRHQQLWLDQGLAVVPVSVNLSRCNVYDASLSQRLLTLPEQYSLPISLLHLEITESAYVDNPQQLLRIVSELRRAGFVVEMDDFGVGYSSLNMLKDLPVDVLKLDAQFISESENDERAATVLSYIIRMARQLGLSVIAEGVETSRQADFLAHLDCTVMQGYFFARPMPVDQFMALLRPCPAGQGTETPE